MSCIQISVELIVSVRSNDDVYKCVYIGLIGFGFTGRYSTYRISAVNKDIKDWTLLAYSSKIYTEGVNLLLFIC